MPTRAQFRPISYADLRRSAMRSKGMAGYRRFGFGDAPPCLDVSAAGPLQPGQVYCQTGTTSASAEYDLTSTLSALSTVPQYNQASLTQSLLANPLTYFNASGASGSACVGFAFPWIGNADGSGNCVPLGGIPTSTGNLITGLVLAFFGLKLISSMKG